MDSVEIPQPNVKAIREEIRALRARIGQLQVLLRLAAAQQFPSKKSLRRSRRSGVQAVSE